jgi:hypothetical protein
VGAVGAIDIDIGWPPVKCHGEVADTAENRVGMNSDQILAAMLAACSASLARSSANATNKSSANSKLLDVGGSSKD